MSSKSRDKVSFVAGKMPSRRQQERTKSAAFRRQFSQCIAGQKTGEKALRPVLGFMLITSLTPHKSIYRQPICLAKFFEGNTC